MAVEHGPARSFDPSDAARAFAAERAGPGTPPDAWRSHMRSVRAEALGLAREGRITILRKGKPVDPTQPVKGLIRLALAGDEAKKGDAKGDDAGEAG